MKSISNVSRWFRFVRETGQKVTANYSWNFILQSHL